MSNLVLDYLHLFTGVTFGALIVYSFNMQRTFNINLNVCWPKSVFLNNIEDSEDSDDSEDDSDDSDDSDEEEVEEVEEYDSESVITVESGSVVAHIVDSAEPVVASESVNNT